MMVNGVTGCCDTGAPSIAKPIGRQSVNYYAGIDVSLELSSVCIVDATGEIVKEAKAECHPDAPASAPRPVQTKDAMRTLA